jgi:Methyltransferase domain
MLIILPGPDGEISVNISDYWSDQYGIGIKGWVSAADSPPQDLEFVYDGAVVPVTSWHAREDLAQKAPVGFLGRARGFWCYLPSTTPPSLTIQRRNSKARHRRQIQLRRHPPKLPDWHPRGDGTLFEQFRAEMNRSPGKILELGSRQVVKGGQSKRGLFPECSYVGFDYYQDANTDVVGDAHELSKFFGCEFNGVFSLAVFEHFAMPWLVAAEINKVLKVGGLTFHATHFAFPPHERPWDFWRYTDQGLRVLFSPPLGFEVIGSVFDTAVRIHPDKVRDDLVHLPLEPAWVGVSVLARKTAEIDPARFIWSASVSECLGPGSHYPRTSG